MPNHSHGMEASGEEADRRTPASNRSLAETVGGNLYGSANGLVAMDSRSLPDAGGGQAHNNMQPYLAMSFIIALVGTFPSRS